ncbi:MAG: TVP38/TMEM64 family protein [Oscillospiraceae bacterium]|jgi:uncharacterized membrane protein YdjX (TVP38/TMEM64 family)
MNNAGGGNKTYNRENQRRVIVDLIAIAVLISLIILALAEMIPILRDIASNSLDEGRMVDVISAYGIGGIPILIALQTVRIIISVFPSAPIQVLAGLCYGAVIGTAVSLAGIILGNVIVFFIMRRLKDTIGHLIGRTKTKREHKFLNRGHIDRLKHPEYLAFCLYLIPVIPNGIISYVFSGTKISMKRYLLAVSFASIPSILLCTFFGHMVAMGNYIEAVIIFSVIAALIAAVFINRERLLKWAEKHIK